MKIYRNGVEIYDLQIDNKTVINRRLSVENTLTIEYESLVAIVLAIGDYVNIGDEKYVINELPSYTLTGGKYKYSIILKGWLHFLENFMMPDEGRDDFFYFGTLYDHLDYLLEVLNDKQPGWSIVKPNMATISSTPKNLNYAGCSILAAINKLGGADEGYGIEMDIKGQKITFAKAIRRETALTFEYGHDKGLYKISRDKLKNGKLYTRIYGYGGTTNMLDGKRLSFDEKYIEKNIALYGLRENKVKFDEIYPRRNGKITSDAQIVAAGRANWTVADSTLDFDLNKQIVEGAVISFNTGDCAGIEFELITYDATTKIITFKEYADTSQSPAYVLPSAVRFPRSGDEYSFKNIIMPESYVTAAKAELKQATQEYTDKNSVPAHPYTIDCDPRYIKRLEFIPQIGDVVKIIDAPMGLEASIRITAIEYPALYPHKVKLTISDDIIVSTAIIQTIETKKNKDKIEIIDRRAEVSARKQNKALQELSNYLLDTEGYFDTDKFKALSIEARMLAIGMQAQNFTLSEIRVTPNSGNLTTVVVTAGTLIHASLEASGLGSTWAIAGRTLSAPDTSKAYYIYAKCSKNTLQGTIEISEIELKVEHFPNYYVFNLGVLYPQRSGESWRDYSATYGVTSIVGDQIYGGGIKALDGFNFVDLRAAADNGRFRLGHRTNGSMDYGVTEPNTFTLINTKLVSKGGNSSYAPVYRGAWTNAELYYTGETVTYNGSMYQCMQDCPTAGIMPVNTTYWDKTVSKGDTGAVDEETLNNINNKIDGIQIGGVNLMLNSKQIKLAGEWYNSSPLLFSQPLRPGKNYILSVSNMLDGLYFRIYPAGGGWETGVNVPFNTPFAVNSEFVHGLFYAGVNGTVQTAKLEEGNKVTAWSTAPEDIIIAGENLIINRHDIVTSGADFPAKTSYSSTIINGIRETTVTSLSSDNTTESYRYAFMQGFLAKNLVDLEPGEYVFSFDYKTNCNRGYMQIDIRDAENGNMQVFQSQLLAYTSTWKRGFFIADWRGKTAIHLAMLLLVKTDNSATGNYVAYRNLKLAKGNTGYSDSSSPEDVEAANKKHAEAQKELAEVTSKAYADNVVTAEEARAIADAQSKADAAKREAILTAALDTTDKINNLQLGGVNLLIGTSSAETDLNMPTSNYVFPLGGGILLSTLGLSPGELVTFAAIMSYLSSSISLYRIIVTCAVNGVTQYFYGAFVGIGNRAHCSITIPSGATTIAFYFSLVTAPTQAAAFKYKCIKLERGNKPTDWSPAPNDTITQAVESSAKNLGLTKIDGGLIWTNLVKLQRIGGTESAGISGIDKNSQGQTLPSFWAGGTYSQALNRQANVDIYHNGKAKLGRLFVNEDGSTVYKDTSSVERIYITPEYISTLADLTGSSSPESGVNTNSYSKAIVFNTFSQDVLLGTVSVSKNSSDLMIKNIAISVSIINNVPLGSAAAEVRLYVKRDGAFFAWIDNVGVNYYYKDESPLHPSASKTIDTTFKVPLGTYQLFAEVYLSTTSDMIDATCYISAGRLTWQYIANISKSELGQNGLLSFRDINNYIYAAIENNRLNFVIKTNGKWDTPGVLAAYSVDQYGNIKRRWGGKTEPYANANRASIGVFDIPHLIGHTDYIATANVVSTIGTNIVMIGQKYNNSVRVVIRNLVNDLENMDFDVIITGRNA